MTVFGFGHNSLLDFQFFACIVFDFFALVKIDGNIAGFRNRVVFVFCPNYNGQSNRTVVAKCFDGLVESKITVTVDKR